ncbi:hypothetical protein LTR78_009807 [Recurvomyces mirabilis]|uniref:HbrB-like protein n=1 Tax=Recurvomyces mirabilis TaxID=574656 RepID=A0AAE0TRT5_9PEZI|nr:hypothetical protein LTR78_009807 [Recurvomyces mirabilis]KAK5158224.1 hypothetical protein LTS14_003242 [Recurvomyces mirabilis]
MNSNTDLPPLRPPPRPRSPSGQRSQSSLSQSSLRSESSLSTVSNDSAQQMPPPLVNKRSPYLQHAAGVRPATSGGSTPSQSSNALPTIGRLPYRTSIDAPARNQSPNMGQVQFARHQRQHSQGFFEPSLPHATTNNTGLSASTIAAQAAMHHISPPASQGNERKRSYPGLAPINTAPEPMRRPSATQSPQVSSAGGLSYSNGSVGGHRLAATTAANVAFPNGRSPLPSPNAFSTNMIAVPSPPLEKEAKSKSSKMKLFSKPKAINLSKDKEAKVAPGMPSPSKSVIGASLLRSGFANASTTSLVPPESSASSLYSSANASTSTLVPTATNIEREKEKKHHFLSRQKHKPKDDPSQLPLSSAHSNSQATNPDKPQPLYSFTPDSPGPNSFAKSMSGFDLRHGGRALREKKKEEKAAAAAAKLELVPVNSNGSGGQSEQYLGPSQYDTSLGPPSGPTAGVFSFLSDTNPSSSLQAFSNIGTQMGLPGIGPDDAWPLLKARLLNLFSGEELRTPVEDFNMLVNVHIRRCIQRKSPVVLVEDVRELLQTGFTSLSQTLRGVPDDRLVLKLVEMWIGVQGSILPFLQAVFLPLDLEFKGRGVIMSVREAHEFWGAMPESLKSDERPSSSGGMIRLPSLGEELEIRRITLITFRDTVILPRHESLMATFSRLSLDSINAAASPEVSSEGRNHARSDPATTGAERPDTAGSLSPHMSSFNSQGSTLLDAASSSSGGAMSLASRSRATSNTSAGSFGTSMPHLNSPLAGPGSFNATNQPSPAAVFTDPAKVTDTVARMLQCLYVLASCQTGDVGQGVVERLTGALKYNWLGRGRTGRDRRGFVGMKPGRRVGLVGA